MPGFHETLEGEVSIGLGDGGRIDSKAPGEFPDGGKASPGRSSPAATATRIRAAIWPQSGFGLRGSMSSNMGKPQCIECIDTLRHSECLASRVLLLTGPGSRWSCSTWSPRILSAYIPCTCFDFPVVRHRRGVP